MATTGIAAGHVPAKAARPAMWTPAISTTHKAETADAMIAARRDPKRSASRGGATSHMIAGEASPPEAAAMHDTRTPNAAPERA
jgi:hypothetical protein